MADSVTAETFLQSILSEIEKINREAKELAAGLGEQQQNWQPTPEVWSMAQCFEHLTLSTEKFWPYFEKLIAKAPRTNQNSAPPYKPTWMGKWMIDSLGPKVKRKMKSPKIFRPSPQPAPGALDRFLAQRQTLVSFAARAKEIDVNTKLRSPVTPLIRYSLGDAFQLIVVHDWRHLKQAGRIKELPEFPKSKT